jgi:hypothetical protein
MGVGASSLGVPAICDTPGSVPYSHQNGWPSCRRRHLSRIWSVDQRLAIGFAAGTDSQVQGMAGKSPLSATEEQRAALIVLAGSRDRGEADRARAVLLTLAGWTSPRLAEAFGVREDTVRLWRSNFRAGGVKALKASVAPAQLR